MSSVKRWYTQLIKALMQTLKITKAFEAAGELYQREPLSYRRADGDERVDDGSGRKSAIERGGAALLEIWRRAVADTDKEE